jgi:hypothetical protein
MEIDPFLLRLFVDDLQDDAAGVALRYHALSHEDVMSPLARVDDTAVAKPEPEVKCLTASHGVVLVGWNSQTPIRESTRLT